jgi:hypothetical protein
LVPGKVFMTGECSRLAPPHHQNTLVRPEGFGDIEEHECGVAMEAMEVTNHDYGYQNAIAVKLG